MSLSQTIPREYGYVLGVATLSTIVAAWHTINTGQYRRAAKITYPNAYATHAEAKESKDAYLFNCAQRSHTNYMEHQPQMLVGLLVGGLKYPVLSAGMGAAWCASRVAYMIGYCRRDQEQGRGRIVAGYAATSLELAMIVMSGMTGYQIVMN